MLIAASTVKDTLPHVRRLVAGNLAGGLDHLVVFLDQPGAPEQDAVAAFLDAHPHVTCVRAGKGWWGERRPAGLNERQCTNATAVSHLLSGASDVDWVFHIDGDEVVRIDRAVLASVPGDIPAVRLAPREAVSQRSWEGEPTLFKRELDEPDLRLLHLLGLIAEPTNRDYFHGHLQGKAGVRPGRDSWLGLHKAITAAGGQAETFTDERLELFHYESYSGEEFVRKWSAMITSGPRASFRPGRAAVADAVRTLMEKQLDPEVCRAQLLAIYARTTEDDVATLTDLGLVLDTDPLAGEHVPVSPSPSTAAVLQEGLEALRGVDKSRLFKGSSPRSGETPDDRARSARSGKRTLFGRPT
ncbi:hypothetical protein BH09ACT12_BH09ACT12_18510 [soil metagenome]